MKPPPFRYVRAASLGEAIDLLARSDGEGKILAGGQSLMPMLAYRLATPAILVDISRLPGLREIEITAGAVRLGALLRWRDLENSRELLLAHPLLHHATSHIAHYQVRNRGTIGGSLAHADPAAELPGIAVACDGVIEVTGPSGSRRIAARDFFQAALTTDLTADEIITALELPAWPRQRRWGFQEFARRKGDFALAGAAVFYDLDTEACVSRCGLAAIGVGDTPLRLTGAEKTLRGKRPGYSAFQECAAVAEQEINPATDIHATGAYRRSLLATLVERALLQAAGPLNEAA